MVCSACGFENAGSMRFCGMCGTPLPHRPMTTPGAQSTLNMTRVPLEGAAGSREPLSSSRSVSAAGVVDGSPHETSTISSSGPAPVSSTVAGSTVAAPIVPETPPKELVPDISLEEYLRKFRYQPPTDNAETTMRGDAAPPVVEPEAPAAPEPIAPPVVRPPVVGKTIVSDASAPVEAPVKSVALPKAPPPIPKPPGRAIIVPAADSVVSRLGLEPESPAEEKIQRPRFLDVNEAPAKENKPATLSGPAPSSGTATIVGPSFLGLSDAPYIAADPEELEEGAPRTSHWRGWAAAVILLVFAALGVMEWRSQTRQTNNGPVEIIRAKLHNWRHGGATPPDETASATQPAPADSSAKPDMQVQEQPKPQTPDQSQSATNPSGVTTAPSPATTPPATTPPAAQTSTSDTTVSKPSAALTTSSADNQPAPKNPTPAKAASNPPDTGKPTRRDKADNKSAASSKQTLPGVDEMTKAQNASDSAAAAAWLWKATAKGNPDAPVQLADMYIKGSGVPRSCEQALVLLKTAAEKENALARNRLASMYATGNCVQRNRVEAYHWLSSALAANPDSQWAQQNRDLIWNQMTPDEQAAAQKYR